MIYLFLAIFMTQVSLAEAKPMQAPLVMSLRCVDAMAAKGDINPSSSPVTFVGGHQALSMRQKDQIRGVVALAQKMGVKRAGQPIQVEGFPGGRPNSIYKCGSFTYATKVQLSYNCLGGAGTGDMVAKHFAHEFGHAVGLSGYYGAYEKSAPKCEATSYCTANHGHGKRNEEFAEVFGLYLLAPDVLKRSCPGTTEWLEKNGVFTAGANQSCGGTGSGIDGLLANTSSNTTIEPAGVNFGGGGGSAPSMDGGGMSGGSFDMSGIMSLASQMAPLLMMTMMPTPPDPNAALAGAQPTAADQSAGVKDAPTPASTGPAPMPNNGYSNPTTGYSEQSREPASGSSGSGLQFSK